MQRIYRELTVAFRRNRGKISSSHYNRIVSKYITVFEDGELFFLMLQASGYPIVEEKNGYLLETYITPYKKQKFCVVDIETNGSKPENSQVIEIGAVIVQDNKIIDSFESFVNCSFLPSYITKITGITLDDLNDAPTKLEVLTRLKEFMGNSIFVAHNANFDYNFLNYSFNYLGLGTIGNQVLCSINLAKRTIESEKYGLAYLNDFLGLGVDIRHRAFSDAITTAKLLNIIFNHLPKYVKSADELLRFSISTRKDRTQNFKK